MKKNYYKLNPEIKDFILTQAKGHPELGCRKMITWIEREFGVKLSKSSINTVIKQAGLSKKAGRPRSPSFVLRPSSIVPRPSAVVEGMVSQPEPDSEIFLNKALGIKFVLADDTFFFIDAAFNTVWPDINIPLDFSVPLVQLKGRLNDSLFLESRPLILQVVPGYEGPLGIFWGFVSAFEGQEPGKVVSRIELYGGQAQGLVGIVDQAPARRVYFIIGLWPWQYKDKGIFGDLRFIEYAPGGISRFCLLTNLKKEGWDDQRVVEAYLERWPFPEKSYQRLLEKIIRL